jgi:hypothetical protein
MRFVGVVKGCVWRDDDERMGSCGRDGVRAEEEDGVGVDEEGVGVAVGAGGGSIRAIAVRLRIKIVATFSRSDIG